MSGPICTCDVKPPRREAFYAATFRYMVYGTAIDDRTVFDAACPFHGERGIMVAEVVT